MKCYEIGKAGAPRIAFVAPACLGWWAMAPLSNCFRAQALCTLVELGSNGGGARFESVAAAARALAVESERVGGFAACVGVGLGGAVALEAALERASFAQTLVVGDVLCVKEPGAGASAALTAATWPLARHKRYARRLATSWGLSAAMVPELQKAAGIVGRQEARAQLAAEVAWRIPGDSAALKAPVVVAASQLAGATYTKSAQALVERVPHARLEKLPEVSQGEAFMRAPARVAELITGALTRVGYTF
jgi:pimeloyl-ACP methyl ester carboxylesterase